MGISTEQSRPSSSATSGRVWDGAGCCCCCCCWIRRDGLGRLNEPLLLLLWWWLLRGDGELAVGLS
ncbi:hypothetical protein BpHYR1_025599 [Brachionus plicatilis]|uniref:Uncharacterized protein n=1 Tax=Brachionus plicatilis TaxID=10195 RepID=A0A3M7QG51_BRAPC|nr:hypothetical protein BpHYR1_025599 [Brachionus plicatilis]